MNAATGELILAIDVGTQSVRALVFDPRGAVAGSARRSRSSRTSRRSPAGPSRTRSSTGGRSATRAGLVGRRDRHDGTPSPALTLTTQRATVVVTDADGRPLRPAIVWLDQRQTPGLPEIGGLPGLAFTALGVRDTVAAFQADCEANWIRANEPEVWAAIRHYLFLSGYLVHRLTGRFVDSVASQVGYVPFDYKRFRWARAGDWRWQAAPVDAAWLPELVAADRSRSAS